MWWRERKSEWGWKKRNRREVEHMSWMRGKISGQLNPAEAVSVLASSQGTGGRVCYSFVAVICFREVHSKLVQTAQPGSASWVNMQPRRGLLTTDSPWPSLQSLIWWNADLSTISNWVMCMWLNSTLFHTSVKSFACMLLALQHIYVRLFNYCYCYNYSAIDTTGSCLITLTPLT